METEQLQVDSKWDYDQLIKFGAYREFVEQLSPQKAIKLLKNIFYAVGRYKLLQEEDRLIQCSAYE